MQKIECELCGSLDILRTDDGFFQCQHCGRKYTLEQARALLGGVVETTIGSAELQRRVENAKAKISLGHYPDDLVRSITNDFPANYEGYWLSVKYGGWLNWASSYNDLRQLIAQTLKSRMPSSLLWMSTLILYRVTTQATEEVMFRINLPFRHNNVARHKVQRYL